MITSGLEDYLELIYNSISANENLKAVDISNKLNVSRASVSEALIRLADLGFIIYEGRKGIKMTDKGISIAKEIIEKHAILSLFFTDVLNIDSQTSNHSACKIEHVIDKKIIDSMKLFIKFAKSSKLDVKFREFTRENTDEH